MEWKIDEGWSYEWCNYCITVGYQIDTDKKAGVIAGLLSTKENGRK